MFKNLIAIAVAATFGTAAFAQAPAAPAKEVSKPAVSAPAPTPAAAPAAAPAAKPEAPASATPAKPMVKKHTKKRAVKRAPMTKKVDVAPATVPAASK